MAARQYRVVSSHMHVSSAPILNDSPSAELLLYKLERLDMNYRAAGPTSVGL
jgi:hypothetical protein